MQKWRKFQVKNHRKNRIRVIKTEKAYLVWFLIVVTGLLLAAIICY